MDKRLARCGEVKPRSAFYRDAHWNDGLHPYCRPCLLRYQSERRLAKLDAANPDRQRWTKWSVKHDYFREIDEPIKAYLLGLVAADGNVLEYPPRITLQLNIKDIELVELFRDQVAPAVAIKRRPPRGLGGESATISVTSQEVAQDLAEFGVVPRKTWSCAWPLPDEMKRPYLLGYFDGDGYITVAHRYRERVYGRWGLCGTANFLEDAMKFVAVELRIARRTSRPSPRIHRLNIDGQDALSVDRWLHEGLPFGLARKRLNSLLAAAASGARGSDA